MPEQVIVEIDEQGNSTVTVKGVAGVSCKSITEDLEKALGKVTEDKKTSDYYLPEPSVRQQVRR